MDNGKTKSQAAVPPPGPLWLHEIKHDGFRIIARKHIAIE
jgi:ATP-dependent DNA ligase